MKNMKLAEVVLAILSEGDLDRHQLRKEMEKRGKPCAESSLESTLGRLRAKKTIGRYRKDERARGRGWGICVWTVDYSKDEGRMRHTVESIPIELPDFDSALLARMGYAPIQPRTPATFEHDEKKAKHSMAAQTPYRQFGIQSGMGMFNQV